jgi:type IX secretion system PorP/SprF family membrane protein
MFNNLYYNPGFSGIEGVNQASLLYRSQWTGYQPTNYGGGAPTTILASYTAPLNLIKSGVGGYIMGDRLGPITTLEIHGSYAYHFRLKGGKLGLGVRVGAINQTIDSDLYNAIDENDPLLPAGGKVRQTKPDVSLGLFYRKEKFYLGAGFSHILQPRFDFGLPQSNALKTHMTVAGGYFYEVNFDLKVQLATLVKTDFVKTQYDLGVIAYMKDTMWGGLAFRQSEALSVLLGWSFLKDKMLKAGYAMDVVIKDRAAKQPLSHELVISYQLPVSSGVNKKAIRTPRFRH